MLKIALPRGVGTFVIRRSRTYPVFIRGPWRETDRGKSVIVMEVPILRIPLSPEKKTSGRTDTRLLV